MKISEFFYSYREGYETQIPPESVTKVLGEIEVYEVAYIMELIRLREEGFNDPKNKKSERELRAVLKKYDEVYTNIRHGISDIVRLLFGNAKDSKTKLLEVLSELKRFDPVFQNLDADQVQAGILELLKVHKIESKDQFEVVKIEFIKRAILTLGCKDQYGFVRAVRLKAVNFENPEILNFLYASYILDHPQYEKVVFADFKDALNSIVMNTKAFKRTKLLYYNSEGGERVIVSRDAFYNWLDSSCRKALLFQNKEAHNLYNYYDKYINGSIEDDTIPIFQSEKIGKIPKHIAIYVFEIIRASGIKSLEFFEFHKVFEKVLKKIDNMEVEFKELIKKRELVSNASENEFESLKKEYKSAVDKFMAHYKKWHPFFESFSVDGLEAFLKKAKGNGSLERLGLIDLNNEASRYTLYGSIVLKKLNSKAQINYEFLQKQIQGRYSIAFETDLFKEALDSLIEKVKIDKLAGGILSLERKTLNTDSIFGAVVREYQRIERKNKGAEKTISAKVIAGSLPGYESSTSSHKHEKSSSHKERLDAEKEKAKSSSKAKN